MSAKGRLREVTIPPLAHTDTLSPHATVNLITVSADRTNLPIQTMLNRVLTVTNITVHSDSPRAILRRGREITRRRNLHNVPVRVRDRRNHPIRRLRVQMLASLHVHKHLLTGHHRDRRVTRLRVSGTNLTHMVTGLDNVHASRSERRTNSESRQRRASHATGTHLTRILHLCQKAHLSSHSAAQSATETTCHPAPARTRTHATNATARHTREPKPNRTDNKLVHEQTISQTNR